MARAVHLCQKALQTTPEQGFSQLVEGMRLAQNCFEQWGLQNLACEKGKVELLGAGAQAVKLTGSGDGGFLLGLWENGFSGSDLLECF
jgi:mevalonate kinase